VEDDFTVMSGFVANLVTRTAPGAGCADRTIAGAAAAMSANIKTTRVVMTSVSSGNHEGREADITAGKEREDDLLTAKHTQGDDQEREGQLSVGG
jgi:hypothetical protein